MSQILPMLSSAGPAVVPGSAIRNVMALARDPMRTQVKWHERHGDLILLALPGFRVWFADHPELVQQVLVRDNASYRKDFFSRRLQQILGQGLLTNEGESWRTQRRLVQPGFCHSALQGYAEAMVDVTEQHLERWRDVMPIDAHAEMTRLTLQVVATTLFGADIGDQATRISHCLDVWMVGVMGVFNTGYRIPMAVPTPSNLRMRRALAELDAIIAGLVDHHRAQPQPDTLLGMLVAATDDDGVGMSDRQLRDEALTLLMAGHETTAAWLTVTLYLLSQHPRIEERLHDELDAQLSGRTPTLADVSELPYTRAVLDEVLRLYPPAYTVGREAKCATELGGQRIEEGDQVWTSQWAVHRDARWFDEPERFDPERWLDGRTAELPKGAYFPFGLGPRICIGKRFAQLEATLVLATLAQRWSVRLSPGEELRMMSSITLRPEGGLSMIASRREVGAS